MSIPVIDIAGLYSPDGIREIAKQLRQVYSVVGFGQVINHPIPQSLIEEMLSLSKSFHALSTDEKMKIKAHRNLRGFIPNKSYSLKKTGIGESTSTPNLSDSLGVMVECDSSQSDRSDGTYFSGENQWPATLPRLKTVALRYTVAELPRAW